MTRKRKLENRVEELERAESGGSFHVAILDENGRFEHEGELLTPEHFEERFPKVELIAIRIVGSGESQ